MVGFCICILMANILHHLWASVSVRLGAGGNVRPRIKLGPGGRFSISGNLSEALWICQRFQRM